MILDRKNVAHGSIPVGKVMPLSSTFTTTPYNTVPPAPGLEWGTLAASTDGYVLTCSAAAAEGVAWAAPVTGTGASTQTANTILSGPATGAAAAPTFRALVTADLPTVIATPTITIGSNHMTWGSASPTTGTWAVGDVCWNTAAAAGGSPGWVNTSASGSGTWKAMANLAS